MSKLYVWLGKTKRQAHRMLEFLIGLFFMVTAGACIGVSMHEWRNYLDHPSAGLWRFYMFAAFTILLIFLSLYSFLKARSIR